MYDRLLIGLVGIILGMATAWFWQAHKYDARIAETARAQAVALATANAEALKQTTELQRKKDAALKLAQDRATANANAAATARAESDSLRTQLASAGVQLSGASCASVRDYTATLSVVFDQCQRSYQDLADKADGHASDARTLMESWPVK